LIDWLSDGLIVVMMVELSIDNDLRLS